MKKIFHRKLIRDKIPQVIEAAGDEYESELWVKGNMRKN